MDSFLKDPIIGQKVRLSDNHHLFSKNVHPQHYSIITIIFTNGMIFLVHTEATFMTDEFQEFEDEQIELFPPKTIIINISGDLSGQKISASVPLHELANVRFPRSTYEIEVFISSGNLFQTIRVSMNRYELGEEETGSDGSVRMNIVIDSPLVSSDGTVFLAKLLNDDTTIEQVESVEEEQKIAGSIRFGPVLKLSNMQDVD